MRLISALICCKAAASTDGLEMLCRTASSTVRSCEQFSVIVSLDTLCTTYSSAAPYRKGTKVDVAVPHELSWKLEGTTPALRACGIAWL